MGLLSPIGRECAASAFAGPPLAATNIGQRYVPCKASTAAMLWGCPRRERGETRDSRSSCGGRCRTRTDDLFRVKEARYQLRQSPIDPGVENRYYRNDRADFDHSTGHARDPCRVLRVGNLRLMFYKCPGRRNTKRGCSAVVAHHLAKVRVASSNLVIRSSAESLLKRLTARGVNPHGGVAERLGTGLQSRLHGFESRRHLAGQLNSPYGRDWRSGSALP